MPVSESILIKIEIAPQVFSANFAKFLRTPFLIGDHRWLLDKIFFDEATEKIHKDNE